MAIIIEGFDNSGKSTLAKHFAHLGYWHPGTRPFSWLDARKMMNSQLVLAKAPIAIDRITAISHLAYSLDMRLNSRVAKVCLAHAQAMLENKHCVLIYCRPPLKVIKDFSSHEEKAYDSPENTEWLKQNAEAIVKRYDRIMSKLPHMWYDYTKPNDSIISLAIRAQYTLQDWEKWISQTRT